MAQTALTTEVDNVFTRQHKRNERVGRVRKFLGLPSNDYARTKAEDMLCEIVERLQERDPVYITKKDRGDGTYELLVQ